jgi:fatty-acyl-CoA synthase
VERAETAARGAASFLAEPGLSMVRGAPAPWRPLALGEALAAVAAWRPGKPALVQDGRALSFGELHRQAAALAGGLAAIGVAPGSPTVVLMDNCLEWPVTFFALALAGSPVVPLNSRFVAREMAYVLRHSGAGCLVAADRFGRTTLAERLAEIAPSIERQHRTALAVDELPALRRVVRIGGAGPVPWAWDWADLVRAGGPAAGGGPAAVGLIQYTSGTTGFPKGVMLRQDQILRNAWAVGSRLGLRATDVMYSPMPFFHVGGAVLSVLFTVQRGATLVFPERFDPEHMLETIEREACTVTAGVETMFRRLMEHPRYERFRGPTLRAGWGAGPREIFDRLTGFVNIYGLSENSPNAAMAYFDEPLASRRDSCGVVQPGMELGVARPDAFDNDWLPLGTVGEIRIRGWGVMAGYLNDPETTARTVDAGGWLHTGDLGWIDEGGAVHFQGRIKDTLRVGGEVVAAGEIEAVLARHPKVRAVYVVGIPDGLYGEVPVAFVVSPAGPALAPELLHLAHAELAKFKVPRHLRFCEDADVPVTESGKVQKYVLRDRFLGEPKGRGPA